MSDQAPEQPRIVTAPEQWLTAKMLEENPSSEDYVWIYYQNKYFLFKLKIYRPEEGTAYLDWEDNEGVACYVSEGPGFLAAVFPELE